MPTEKRNRQRAGREARRAQAQAAQRRAQRRRQVIAIVILFALILGIGVAINRSGDDSSASGVSTATTTTAATDPFAAVNPGDAPCPPADGAAERRIQFDGPPRKCIDETKSYRAIVETDVGSFTVELDPEDAPLTTNNFVFLARYHFYDDVPFHRVIPGFVVQGGDAEKGDGTGGPGYEFADELPEAGAYREGSVAMANSGPDTNGSQFFVVTGERGAQLPPNYSLFGQVVEGMDVVKKIESDGTESGTPATVHRIVKVTIEER